MPREYKHIKNYEKEIIELRKQGRTNHEICERFEFCKRQSEILITRHNRNQDKIAAEIVSKKKGKAPKDYVVRDGMNVSSIDMWFHPAQVDVRTPVAVRYKSCRCLGAC